MTSTKSAARIDSIWPDDAPTNEAMERMALRLRQDTASRDGHSHRSVGEKIPEFALLNQKGEIVMIHADRKHLKVINFIFTRCAAPTMCPAETTKMIALQKAAAEAGIKNLRLYSISFDPKNDTPGVLAAYAGQRGIDTSNFEFLTGGEQTIEDLIAQIGITTVEENGTIAHSVATVLVDEHGKIIHRSDGNRWTPQDFLVRMD